MFTIDDWTVVERQQAAKACGKTATYLWQCGKGLRTPSLSVAHDLLRFDSRLTVAGLLEPKRKRAALLKTLHKQLSREQQAKQEKAD